MAVIITNRQKNGTSGITKRADSLSRIINKPPFYFSKIMFAGIIVSMLGFGVIAWLTPVTDILHIAGKIEEVSRPGNNSIIEVFSEMKIQDRSSVDINSERKIMVRVAAYPYQQFGTLEGKLERLITDNTGRVKFLILLNHGNLSSKGRPIHIILGMSVDLSIEVNQGNLLSRITKHLWAPNRLTNKAAITD